MIELPESLVLSQQISKTLTGKRVASVVANHTPHGFAWYAGDPAEYESRLKGKTVTAAGALGGQLKVAVGDMTLLLGTPVRYCAPGEKLPAKHQLLIRFEDGSAMSCTVQMWGALFCFNEGNKDWTPPPWCLQDKPSPLDDEFDYPYFQSLARGLDLNAVSAKAFLATEQRIPGLGNGVLQDILWTSRVHPKRKMATLSPDEWRGMYDSVKAVLAEMVSGGGRDTERDLFGREGGYKTVLSKKTAGKPCHACGEDIRKEAFLGGSIYYCPGCQPENP